MASEAAKREHFIKAIWTWMSRYLRSQISTLRSDLTSEAVLVFSGLKGCQKDPYYTAHDYVGFQNDHTILIYNSLYIVAWKHYRAIALLLCTQYYDFMFMSPKMHN